LGFREPGSLAVKQEVLQMGFVFTIHKGLCEVPTNVVIVPLAFAAHAAWDVGPAQDETFHTCKADFKITEATLGKLLGSLTADRAVHIVSGWGDTLYHSQ
jgi:hypothetical protein